MRAEKVALPENWRKTLYWTLVAFTLGITVVTLIGEVFKTHLIGYMRFADFVDLAIMAPMYMATLMLFHDRFLEGGASRRLRWLFLALAMLFLYGHSMHLTANTIDTFSVEIRGYRPLIPDDAYALIYFLDETLSHLIVFIVRYALLGCLLVLEAMVLFRSVSRRWRWPGIVAGAIYGLWEAIVFTEGQKPWLLPFLVVAVGVLWLWLWRRSGSDLATFLGNGPVTAFIAALLPATVVGLVLYGLLTGGWIEPSELSGLGPRGLLGLVG